jgi:mannose-6-phosphate isomerase-like protein (cupin superfamily)
MAQPVVARLAESEPVPFGPLSFYNKLIGDGALPMFTGVQTCAPGYQTAVHWHPYAEYLFVLEGVMEAWVVGEEAHPVRLEAGDMIALPADTPHGFRNPGPGRLRLLGIHHSPERIVNRDADPPGSPGNSPNS